MPNAIPTANFTRNGLPIEVQKRLAAEIWGSPDAVDAVAAFTPMNIYKAKMAKWSLLRKELHDSLSLCNWMGPWVASPLKSVAIEVKTPSSRCSTAWLPGDKKSAPGARSGRRADLPAPSSSDHSRYGHQRNADQTRHDSGLGIHGSQRQGSLSPKEPSAWIKKTSSWQWTCITKRWAGTKKPDLRPGRHIRRLGLETVADEFNKRGLLP